MPGKDDQFDVPDELKQMISEVYTFAFARVTNLVTGVAAHWPTEDDDVSKYRNAATTQALLAGAYTIMQHDGLSEEEASNLSETLWEMVRDNKPW